MARTCGSCFACCVVPEINDPALKKPAGTPCVHLRQQGPCCGVYDRRPETCRRFSCAWLDGLGAEEDRPDRSGLFVYRRRDLQERFGCPGLLLAAELRAGAYAESPWMAEREKTHAVYVIRKSGTEGLRGKGIERVKERLP